MTATLQAPGTGGDIASAVVLAPTDSARNVIEGVGDVTPFTLKAETGQTAPLEILRDEAGNVIAYAQPAGGPNTIYWQIGPAHASFQMSNSGIPGNSHSSNGAWYVDSDDGAGWVEAFFNVSINPDGTARFAAIGVDSDLVNGTRPGARLALSDDVTQGARLRVQPIVGQTAPVIDCRDENNLPAFQVGPDGVPLLTAPNGSQWRLLVDNAGTLSTVAA